MEEYKRQIADLVSVCKRHFLEGETQSQIANDMQISHAKVSKMITEAEEMGLVSIEIHDPFRQMERLSLELQDKYGLKKAVIVPVPEYGAKNILARLGIAAAVLFEQLLKVGDIVGVSGGATLYEVLKKIECKQVLSGTIVPFLGGFGEAETATRGSEIAYRLAEKLGSKIVNLPAPGLARDAAEAKMFSRNPLVKKSISWIRRCTIALVGIGSADNESRLYTGGFLNTELLDRLQEEKAVGCIGFCFFTKDGSPCHAFNSRVIGMMLDDLLHIETTIGVAGGCPSKVDAIRGAILGKYLDILVTDQITANALL